LPPKEVSTVLRTAGAPPPQRTTDLSWFFIKLRFRRGIVPRGMVNPPANPTSAFTQAVWAQFLPPFSRFQGKPRDTASAAGAIDVAALTLVQASSGGPWELHGPDGPTTLLPTPVANGSQSEFILAALVTERLGDAAGQLIHERYCAFCEITDDAVVVPRDGNIPSIDDGRRLRARIVEIQQRKGAPGSAFDLKRLFPEESDALLSSTPRPDAVARIVRVSEPIEVPVNGS